MQESLDTGSPTGRFVAHLMASLAALEVETIGQRTREGLAQVFREGRSRSRFAPFGFRMADGGLVCRKGDRRAMKPHAREQATLRRILRWRAKGMGPLRIKHRLDAARLWNRAGKPWSLGALRAVIGTAERRAKIG